MAKEKGGLGKGFDALFGEIMEEEKDGSQIRQISINLIDPNREQPRRIFEQNALEQLAESIRSVGIIQPVILSANGKRFTIVAGERRWRAARLAGLEQIPAIVRDLETVQRMELALIENIQRTDLNAIEEAQAIEALIQQCGLTQEETANRLGKGRTTITNLLRLLTLPEEIRELLSAGAITEGHARALLGLTDAERMRQIAEQIVARGLNVRQTEALVREQKEEKKPESKAKARLAELDLIEEAARNVFGTRVTLQGDEKHGKLVLHYGSRKDLERIYQILAEGQPYRYR